MTVCPVCSNALPDDAALAQCPNCGARLDGATAAQPEAPADAGSAVRGSTSSAPAPRVGRSRAHGRAVSIPWEERERVGIVQALVDTTRLRAHVAVRLLPGHAGERRHRLAASVRRDRRLDRHRGGKLLPGAVPFHPRFRGWARSASVPSSRPWWASSRAGAASLAQLVFGGVMVAIGVFVWAGILHLMLLLLGGAAPRFRGHGPRGVLRTGHEPALPAAVLRLADRVRLVARAVRDRAGERAPDRARQSGGGGAGPAAFFCCCCVGAR